MPCRYRLRYDRKLCQLSIHFPAVQPSSSRFPILPYLLEKAQLKLDLFDRLLKKPRRVCARRRK